MITQICLSSSSRVPCTTLLFSRPLRTTVRPSCKISGSAAGNAGKKWRKNRRFRIVCTAHRASPQSRSESRLVCPARGVTRLLTQPFWGTSVLPRRLQNLSKKHPVQISHFKITFKTHGALCGYTALCAVIWCSRRFMYSAVHTKPLRRLQNLSKEAPG